MRLNNTEIAEAVGGRLLLGAADGTAESISIDSRRIEQGTLFVPIIGEKVDAHRFLPQVFAEGAAAAFTSRHKSLRDLQEDSALWEVLAGDEKEQGSWAVIAVEDTVCALQDLGAYYRRTYAKLPLVGVTGSVGKTTTREMIACALSAGKRVFATKGNANSQVGVPITMTQIGSEAEVGVIELGMSEPGEMERIAKVAAPQICVMTNIGVSHINQLGSQENILREKLHILCGAGTHAVLLLNGDDPLLAALTEEKIHAMGIATDKKLSLLFYGTTDACAVRAEAIRETDGKNSCRVVFDKKKLQEVIRTFAIRNGEHGELNLLQKEEHADSLPAELPDTADLNLCVRGRHMLQNALAALACAACLKVDVRKAAEKLAAFCDLAGRGAVFQANGITVIDDSYNAAPDSMKAALSVLDGFASKGRKIAVLADMLELGEGEMRYHREIGEFIADKTSHIDELYLLGARSAYIAGGLDPQKERQLKVQHFMSADALFEALREDILAGDTLLFKGSNSMGLSALVKRLKEQHKGMS